MAILPKDILTGRSMSPARFFLFFDDFQKAGWFSAAIAKLLQRSKRQARLRGSSEAPDSVGIQRQTAASARLSGSAARKRGAHRRETA